MYDLANDPEELNNVYNDPDYSSIKKNLHTQLDKLLKHYGDSDELTQELLKKDLERKR